jgi:threonine/homoserine/homoserine lactone efflux protein
VNSSVIGVIGDILPFAIGLSVSPFPIIAIVLVLMGPRGRSAGATFLIGRLLGVAIVIVVTAIVAGVIDNADGDAKLDAGIRLVIGLLLIVLAVTKWRPTKDGAEKKLPKWMSALETITAPRSFGLALVLSIANPKEVLLAVAAGVMIGEAGLSTSDAVVAGLAFVVLASLSVAIPVVAFLIAGERARPTLDAVRTWLVKNQSTVMGVVILVIGAVVLGGAIGDLAG